MRREYHKWFSPSVGRDMELVSLGHGGARVVVFPTRAGRFFDYENWGLVEALRHPISQGHLQLFCVDSVDGESLYCSWAHPEQRIRRHMQYERYVMDEVFPLMDRMNPNPFTVAHGCSLGAYHAVNIALRYPHRFGKVVGLSGRYDLTVSVAHYEALFDGYYSDDIYFHTPIHFLPNVSDHGLLDAMRRLEIVLAVGENDPFVHSNRRLSDVLWEKGISHLLRLWQGLAHKASHWRAMVPHYL